MKPFAAPTFLFVSLFVNPHTDELTLRSSAEMMSLKIGS
jgi:hypothetical protein